MSELPNSEVAILNAVLELPAGQRAAYLDRACAGDSALRKQVEALVNAHEQAGSFLEAQPAGLDFQRTVRVNIPPTEKTGDKIGRYKLLQQIGEGGCGVVYMAEQEEPVRRRVALKVIKLGMDTKSVIARFEAERQALALMDHPNIAKVLDAGATGAGRPYFVMELVRGVKITEFCDENKVSTADRLKLFIRVCQAIQHAHQKGIIHRDIKPSNILVTLHDGVPVPKVIDFGIAKATTDQRLTDKTLFTALEQFIGTPAYMSPEQAEMSGLDIDTRCDIYSLGVLLYELLTGKTPFDAKELLASGIDAMRKTIREQEPLRPSTKLSQTLVAAERVGRVTPRAPSSGESLSADGAHGVTRPTSQSEEEVRADSRRLLQLKETFTLLRGDLDWIVMKCLEKDRARRYETANGLASDLQRHLNNEAVLARPPSTAYRFQKLVRRNKLAFAAASAVILTLIAGLSFSTWAFLSEAAQRRTAVEEQRQAVAAQVSEAQQRSKAEAQELFARQRAYASDMDLAYRTWEDGNLARAQELIEANRPAAGQSDLRTFEWRYLWKLCRDESRLSYTNSLAHRGLSPGRVALSSDGRTLIAAAGTKLKLLDATNQWEQPLLEDPDGIYAVVLSPKRTNLLATATRTGGNHTIKLWDLASRLLLATLNGHTNTITAIAFSPDGKLLASASWDHTVRLWDVESKNPEPRVLTQYYDAALSLAFSPDGKYLVTSGSAHGTETPIRIFDLATEAEVTPRLEGHTSWVYALAFSPDGRLLASAGGESTIFVWDFAARKLLYPPLAGHGGNIQTLAFSPDGQRLVSGGMDHTVRIWDVTARRQVGFRRGHGAAVYTVGVSSDGQSIFSVSVSGEECTAKLWHLAQPEERDVLVGPQSVFDLALSPDDKTVASGIYDTFDVQLWDVPSRRLVRNLSGHTNSLLCVAFSPDGKLLATGGRDRTVRLWDPQQFQPIAVLTNEFEVRAVAFARDGHTLAAAGSGINFWDVPSRQLAAGLESDPGVISAVTFSPVDDHVATGDAKGNVVVWDGRTRKPLRSFDSHRGLVWRVKFSDDGTWLASAGSDAGVALYDVRALEMIPPVLKGHTARVTGLAFSPDNKTLASGGFDGRTMLWNVASRQLVLTLKGHVGTSFGVVFSRDGTFMATCGSDAKVRLWPAATLDEADTLAQASRVTGK